MGAKMNQLLNVELEAIMIYASAQLSLKELNETKPKEYFEAFYDGYMFRSEIMGLLDEIYSRGDDLDEKTSYRIKEDATQLG
jgi:hypothetical protein